MVKKAGKKKTVKKTRSAKKTTKKATKTTKKAVKKATRKAKLPKSKSGDLQPLDEFEEYVALAVVDANKYQKENIRIIRKLTQEGTPGVYVTLNIPFNTLKTRLKREKVDLDEIIFIDAVTETAGGKIEKTDDCLFINSPQSLSDISIAMDQAIMAIESKEKFLFFDSLSTLLLYNDVGVVAQFVHFLSSKMRVWRVKGIIISLRRNDDKELINELKSFCDVTLSL